MYDMVRNEQIKSYVKSAPVGHCRHLSVVALEAGVPVVVAVEHLAVQEQLTPLGEEAAAHVAERHRVVEQLKRVWVKGQGDQIGRFFKH
jgi:hypothetical protein